MKNTSRDRSEKGESSAQIENTSSPLPNVNTNSMNALSNFVIHTDIVNTSTREDQDQMDSHGGTELAITSNEKNTDQSQVGH